MTTPAPHLASVAWTCPRCDTARTTAFCLPLAATGLSKALGGSGLLPQWADDTLSVMLVIACAAYLYAAAGPVYGARGPLRMVQALVLTTGVVGLFLVYRFILLPITLYTT